MDIRAPAAAFLILLLVAMPASAEENLSAPNRIPDLSDFKTPQIVPGSSGAYQFSVRNRYNGTLENASLTVEIYKWATLEDAKDIGRISDPPEIAEGARQGYSAPPFSLGRNQTTTVKVSISTSKSTRLHRAEVEGRSIGRNARTKGRATGVIDVSRQYRHGSELAVHGPACCYPQVKIH